MQLFYSIQKNLLILTLSVLSFCSAFNAQEVKKSDPYNITYEKNVLLVKFKDETAIKTYLGKSSGVVNTGIASVDNLYSRYQITDMEQVFKGAGPQLKKQLFKDSKGQVHESGSLDKIFALKFRADIDAKELAKEFSKDENVEYAEPDYHFFTLAKEPDDPLYKSGDQWYINAVHAPEAWEITTGDTTQIIAILDTGVDWEHPDLVNKIWHNWKEIPGNGIDDDGNGKVDDFIGWDFINGDNNPKDDNSHGTHVAGIAAAESNNGVGITGIAWGSKIMPVKILQSSGQGNASTISEGVYYAAKNGATVINMSFGSYGESLVLKNALEYAYSKSVLVAAAGNDALPIIQEGIPSESMYPACYPWVIGVQASQQSENLRNGTFRADFSNFDPSGPVDSKNSYGHNYEITAPGVGINSTIPNNGYKYLSGTSMATPIVAGAVAMMKSHIPSQSTEEIFARLIQSSDNGRINIKKALDYPLQPDLRFVNYTLIDSLQGCDNDGRVDAGETIGIYLTVKNAGGKTDSVLTKLRLGEFEDKSIAVIEDSTGFIGSMSAYASLNSKNDPFRIKINPNAANNRQIMFEYEVSGKNCTPIKGNLIVVVQRGFEVGGLIDQDQVWTHDKEYLVVDNIRIAEGAKLTVKPGTVIKLFPQRSIEVRGALIMTGTNDSMITITSNNVNDPGLGLSFSISNDTSVIKYVDFSYLYSPIRGDVGFSGLMRFTDNIFHYCSQCYMELGYNGNSYFARNVISDNDFNMYLNLGYQRKNQTFKDNLVINNKYNGEALDEPIIFFSSSSYYAENSPADEDEITGNSIYNNFCRNSHEISIGVDGNASFAGFTNNYWGTTDSLHIRKITFDFFDYATKPILKFSPFLKKPSEKAHGQVWKVLINGKNPQESEIDPISSETVRFDIYFNRSMDTKVTPFVTFGVRAPYTQRLVADSASWSSDSTTWTAYYKVGLETGDGINIIRVASAKDPDHFEIPIEKNRFKFTIQAAGAKSTEFIAKADIGKVKLEWPAVKKTDMMGYNMYRYSMINDSVASEISKINNELITDSTYTDFSVTPNKTYYYLYKVVNTDFNESDYSKAVAATPLSAQNGDANGDMTVNVMDITSIVNYLLNKNPQPFIFDAADVNDDGNVNVLDIVSAVNIIMGHSIAPKFNSSSNSLIVLSPNGIDLQDMSGAAAIQMKISVKDLQDAKLIPGDMLKRMEYGYKIENDTLYFVAFNLRNSGFEKNDGQLFRISKGTLQNVKDAAASNAAGKSLSVEIKDAKSLIPKEYSLEQNYPNPFNPATTIRYGLPEKQNVEVMIFNILGQRVRTFSFDEQSAGYHEMIWNSRSDMNEIVSSGVYIYQIKAGKFISQKKMLLIK